MLQLAAAFDDRGVQLLTQNRRRIESIRPRGERPTAERPIDRRASSEGEGVREQLSKDGHLKLTTGVVGSRNSPSFTSSWIACGERETEGKGEGRGEIRKGTTRI